MDDIQIIPLKDTRGCALRVVLDHTATGWVAYCPSLLAQGVLASGESQKDALENLERVLERAGLPEGVQLLVTI